ncbi:uncharacterized protein LOC121410823 [Lytechinus variegatus]|uniref:uncharacterized protein LOC121410823 n=1 Tax=Lytechinus variegatus TaxID=7654 RepID=UPI001BB23FF4|nr:uncharacterized protein LOC121410823 [Lytechinus variegatus]XP_041459071.1 uncharacterized protein LOC121410823 [Lytechinus variegatus]
MELPRGFIIASFILLVSILIVAGEPDPNVCIPAPPTGEGPPLPKLPTQYRLRIEANIKNKDYSLEMQEYYDQPGNRGASDTLSRGFQSHTSYNYNTGQSITTIGDRCFVANMSTTPFNLYGFELVDGSPHIGGVNDIFTFGGKYNETYIGQEYVRGILTNRWQNCMYIESTNQTYLLDYFFSIPSHKTAGGGGEIPVRAVMNGTGQTYVPGPGGEPIPLPTRHSFYHIYDFFEVIPGPVTEERAFEPPLGFMCENRISEQPFPELYDMDVFNVGVELAVPAPANRIYTIWEYYNYKANIVAYQYQPWGVGEPKDPLKEVHDYNLGLSFQIDIAKSSCTVGPIPVYTGEAGSDDGEHVYLRSISSFLQLGKVNWVYEGQSTRRQIPVESWIAQINDFEVGPGMTSNMTLEYFFANESWSSAAKFHHAVNHIPVALDVTYTVKGNIPVPIKSSVSQHFFALNYDAFNPYMTDVSLCYDSKDSKELAIDMEDKYIFDVYVQNSTNSFYFGVVNSLAKAANVTASRISNPVAIEGNGGMMTIYFKLLGIPPVEGDVLNITQQITLEESHEKLDKSINEGLMITFRSEGQQVDLPVARQSLRADFVPAETSGGFTVGALVGMGIGMFVFGGILAMGVAFLMSRMSKGPFSYKTQE